MDGLGFHLTARDIIVRTDDPRPTPAKYLPLLLSRSLQGFKGRVDHRSKCGEHSICKCNVLICGCTKYALTRAVPVSSMFGLAWVSPLSSDALILLDRIISDVDDAESPTPSSNFVSWLAG